VRTTEDHSFWNVTDGEWQCADQFEPGDEAAAALAAADDRLVEPDLWWRLMSDVATHEPARGADFVVRVDLTDHGMPGRSEQLWVKQCGERRFILRSLPFFAYGLRPDDVIETDEDYVVRSVAESSDSRLLRIAASSVDEGDALHAELHPLLERLELEHEWHRYGYVAIKVSTDELPSPLADFIEQWSGAGRLRHEFA
jgi:hypothetical protein